MKPTTAFSLGVGALLLAGAGWMGATEPASAPPGARAGRVLLLENERALQGDVERIGDQYRLRRGAGETWAPASTVLRVCASLDEAYEYLRTRANLNDPDERLRLANWCKQYDLVRQDPPEAEAALQMRPDHAATRRLVHSLRDALRKGPGASAGTTRSPETAVAPVELTSDALGQFATRVQPILMNTCACCHVSGRGGKFQLARAYEAGITNKRTMHQNLTAVLAQVNVQRPDASPLLTKAVSIHAGGMSSAPLRGRQAAPYRALEDWVNLTLANNPQLRERSTAQAGSPPRSVARGGADPLPPLPVPAAPASAAAPLPPLSIAPRPAVAAPAAPTALDPVDPEGFNRQFHPDRKK